MKKITDFGAFVEIMPGTDGLVHISQIAEQRIKKCVGGAEGRRGGHGQGAGNR